MAAFNDSGPSRKRIATYGKAVRKGPSSHVAFKTLQDLERPSAAPKAASVISASTESVTTDSSPSPSSIAPTNFQVFDVPLNDEEETRTPQKKRKLAHAARPSETTSVRNTLNVDQPVLQHVSEKIAEEGARTRGLIHITSVGQHHKPKGPSKPLENSTVLDLLLSEKDSSVIVPTASTKDIEVRQGLLQKRLPRDSASSKYIAINSINNNSSQASRVPLGASTTPRKMQPTTVGNRPSRPSTPTAVDCESHNASLLLSASSILTPKGMKMWNELLGEGSDEEFERSTEKMQQRDDYQNISRNRKLPRRRLIDTLVEQSKNHRSLADTYCDLEETAPLRSNSSLPSQVAENQEESTTHLESVQISPEKINTLCKTAVVGQSSQILGAKITYSRQRSMLAEQDMAKEMDFDVPLHEGVPPTKLKQRRGSIPVLAPLHTLYENVESEDGKVGVAIRTIHELRQAGAESRFKDEVEDLLDRIGSPAPQNTARRSGLMELAERMRDKSFYTKFMSNGIDQRLFLDLERERDVISGFILISLLISIFDAGITPIIVMQLRQQGITRLLARLIDVDENILAIAKARKSNMSKSAQAMLADQHEALLQLRVWGDLQPLSISPRTASLRCLELMVRQSREAGDTGDILSEQLISNLFALLEGYYDKEIAAKDTVDFQLALSTLISHSVNPVTGVEEYLHIVKNILEVTMQNSSEGPTVVLLLRLVLNATNNSPTASDAFASPEILRLMCRAVIERFGMLSKFMLEDQRLVLVDHLVLMLIVMINIVELSIRARLCFLTIEDSSLDDLVKIFQDNIERAFEVSPALRALIGVND